MIKIKKSEERGYADHGWLKSFHTFSFADYYDPDSMNFGVLRVINQDYIEGGQGFGMHGHKDMEIITYVTEGALEHKDSMGNSTIIKPGEVQRMSAGTGIRHSEFNHFKDRKTSLLQIWILPDQANVTPSYEQKSFSQNLLKENFTLVAAKKAGPNNITLNQDVNIYVCKSEHSGEKSLSANKHRIFWLQLIKGTLNINNEVLNPGDAAAIVDTDSLNLKWQNNSEFILFDLPS